MDILLVPGLWLDASSWDAVLPALQKAGHRPRALTMPGVGEPASASGDIGMADWVDAVVAEIDGIEGPVALVGHSGAGNVVYGAADARPDRVAHIVYVDTWPLPDGTANNAELPVVDGAVPLPEWSTFDEAELRDLDEAARERFRER
ncbi:MAG: alpha/beta fold hydrolase, partial [Microbacterium sp.]|nr:alpha/beta fold hydrolase [Microbacterium sp.]